MEFLVNHDLTLIVYPRSFPYKNNIDGYQLLAVANNSNQKCFCGKNIKRYCLLGNKLNGNLIICCLTCLKKHFAETLLFKDYLLSKKLIRKCPNCTKRYLITDKCCGSSDYSSQIQIRKFTGNLKNVLIDNSELVYNGSDFDLVTNYDLNKELISLFDSSEYCIECGEYINSQEKVKKCINCLYPKHGKCIDCNKFIPEMIPGKDKCVSCFKKFMRSYPKRKCNTCGLMEIPNVPSNIHITQCYFCWKKL
jgi:hypothetical protein